VFERNVAGPRAQLSAVLLAVTLGTAVNQGLAQSEPAVQPDKYTWLEDVHGGRQMDWVKSENDRTAGVLEKNPRFATMEAEALKALDSPDRIAIPDTRAGYIYNKWDDAEHVRGILRRTSLEEYLKPEPKWETVLDYDALSKDEHESWVGHGFDCLDPDQELCLAALSAGGEDAATLREFNMKTGKFVEGGFTLPRGKQRVAWVDPDTLLIARDWGPGTMSEAGYPITVREWKRGTLLESAREVFRGDVKDNGYGNSPFVLVDGEGNKAAFIRRNLTTFTHEYYLLLKDGAKKLALQPKDDINGLVKGQLIVSLNEDWTPTEHSAPLKQGSVLALSLSDVEKDPAHLKPTVIFAPTSREYADGVSTTANSMLLTTLNNVQGRAYVYNVDAAGKWSHKPLPVPDNQSVSITDVNLKNDRFFLTLTGFTAPPTLWMGGAAAGTLVPAKSMKALFDASNLVVDQSEATSKDGTMIPYFVVHRKNIPLNGSNPTLLTAYGGFQVSETPSYSPVLGKLWLERGGVFVLANIRGGGEFGPAWHEAGLKTHRQRIYDDFYAVAKDLVDRKITSPQKLGIQGGSNGGLLMGVEFTEHPEMWKAVVIAVPLLDMLSFEHLSAGASWVGEYGSTSVPEERAFLASISPYNQLKPDVNYPEPFIWTTTKDDRVGPVHARKFAARMEEYHKPFYYYEITEGGHGAGADHKEQARTSAATYTYLMMKLMD
jgi:prolyl oligopeptidase